MCGVPMLFMELAVGQYTGRGPIGAIGQLCPLFKGWLIDQKSIFFSLSKLVFLIKISLDRYTCRSWNG